MKRIPLTRGMFALVDDADFELVNQFKWCAHKCRNTFYAARNVILPDGRSITQHMHRFLLTGVSRIDHEDGNGLNNQRDNLRPATASQNGANRLKAVGEHSSLFKGVYWHKDSGKWMARIKTIFLGKFKNEIDAAFAYDRAAKRHFGEFVKLNFPNQQ